MVPNGFLTRSVPGIMTEEITNRIYGCLIGGAIGDALAAPVEGWSHERITREYGRIDEFMKIHRISAKDSPGAVTADTTLRHYVAYAVAEKGRRVTPDDVAEVLVEHLNQDRVWVNSEILVKKLSAGVNPWTAGQGAISNTKVMAAIVPIGIVNACNPEQAFQDGFNIGSLFQSAHDRDAAATVAAGVAEALSPDATVERVLTTMTSYASSIVYRAIDLAMGIAEESGTVDEFIQQYYDRMLDWRWPAVQWDREKYRQGRVFSASSLESLPVAVAILWLCDGDVNQSIIEGTRYGRDSDAVAGVAGGIAGALRGADEIRVDWIEDCEAANTDLFEELSGEPEANFRAMADRLVDVLKNERVRAGEREEQLGRLLGDTNESLPDR